MNSFSPRYYSLRVSFPLSSQETLTFCGRLAQRIATSITALQTAQQHFVTGSCLHGNVLDLAHLCNNQLVNQCADVPRLPGGWITEDGCLPLWSWTNVCYQSASVAALAALVLHKPWVRAPLITSFLSKNATAAESERIEFDDMHEILLPNELGRLKVDRIKSNSAKCWDEFLKILHKNVSSPGKLQKKTPPHLSLWYDPGVKIRVSKYP